MKIFLFLLLLGCANSQKSLLSSTIQEFKQVFPGVTVRSDLITFKHLKKKVKDPATGKKRPAHAYCSYVWTDSFHNKIVINKTWWNRETNDWYKKKVVFHELGHCVLNLRHTQSKLDYSIMNTTLSTVNSDGSNWGYLKGELRMRYLKRLRYLRKKLK